MLDELVADALRIDVAPATAQKARDATRRAVGLAPSMPVTVAVKRRSQAYFSAVVRRSTVRGSAGTRATARFVAAAVVADLREGGRDGTEIWRELQRGWGERLPGDVLEEYRMALCG